jgi:hypothetical protein
VDLRPIEPVVDGTLTLGAPDATGRTYVSAASGLAAGPGGTAWVVSDEYGELGRFDRLAAPGALLPGLPAQREKPDLEALTFVSAALLGGSDALAGAVLALGSGSKGSLRDRGLLQAVDALGQPSGPARVLDFHDLFAKLGKHVHGTLNIEGVAVRSATNGKDRAELLLFHRGVHGVGSSSVFVVDADEVFEAARAGKAMPSKALRSEHELDLGAIGDVPLAFSDADVLPDGRILFAASAERASKNSTDGEVLGSAVGLLDAEFRLLAEHPLTGRARKVEGIELARNFDAAAGARQVTLVTDPDDPARATELLHVTVPGL